MKKTLRIAALLLILLFPFTDALSCTSGIITGRLTKDGRPLLFKHRDTGEMNNRVEFFQGSRYNFLALVDSPSEGSVAWSGSNIAGFCIINTASYNLKDDDIDASFMDREGILMYKALGVCSNLKDFENFLDTLTRPMGVEANFGVIDAEGGAAYYEVNNHSWKKFDVNDPAVAPEGYYIVTNFSFSGREDEGMGYIRNANANHILKEGIKKEKIDPQWIYNNISRSFYHSQLKIDLKRDKVTSDGWFIDQDFIPRKISSASLVFQGVKKGEDPSMTIMWTVLGYPPVGVAVPVIMKFADHAPSYILKSENNMNAELCDLALNAKSDIFPIKRGNGSKYLNFGLLFNKKGTGYTQKLSKAENYIFKVFNDNIDSWRKDKNLTPQALDHYYQEYHSIIKNAYQNIGK